MVSSIQEVSSSTTFLKYHELIPTHSIPFINLTQQPTVENNHTCIAKLYDVGK